MSSRLAGELSSVTAQSIVLADWLESADDVDLRAPSALPGWDLQTLLAHITDGVFGLRSALANPGAGSAVPLSEYVRTVPAAADAGESEVVAAGGQTRDRLIERLREPVCAVPVTADTSVVETSRGPITALDFVRLRLVGLVVHCDDVNRSLPDRGPVQLARPALAAAVRTLAEVLTAQAPGRSVEVRIPPFVAVQAVAGPRHTRGTPPNVVETDPLTWLRLATGRSDFSVEVAQGAVHATGPRSDLTAHLPLLS